MNFPARNEMTLTGGRVVTPHEVLEDGWVRISGRTISAVGVGSVPAPAVDFTDRWIVPGFVDVHCHGGGGGSFTSAEVSQARAAVAAHREHGTTTMLASLVSAPLVDLVRQIRSLAELVEDGDLAGIHLEGPFLSAARCGAHDSSVLRPPDREAVDRLLAAGDGTVRMVTLAPELDGSLHTVGRLADAGILAAIGHTDATLEQVISTVEAGATVATHLFNGMRPLHHREPGPIGVLLEDERVTVELICDLVHLHPGVVRLAARHAGIGRTALVTDAIGATVVGDGRYELGKLAITVTDGIATMADGSLAGSTLTMDAAFRNFVTDCGLTVPDAVAATSTQPAALLGLSDRIGAIRPGLAADLVVLDSDLRLDRVMKNGSWVAATT
jgi:N-acetylglucosamine-6-phosphate deacetylase